MPKTLKLTRQYRSIGIQSGDIDADSRTVSLSFSSDAPCDRWYGTEILGHNIGEVDMSRLNNAAPLLNQHRSDQHIGVVEDAELRGGKGYAKVRFAKDTDSEKVFQQVLDKIKRNVSVGYDVREMQLVSQNGDDKTYRITNWQPMEISMVSMPLDNSVGIGRAVDEQEFDVPIVDNAETEEARTAQNFMAATAEKPPVVEVVNTEEIRSKTRTDELTRVKELSALGRQFNRKFEAEADKAIKEDRGVDFLKDFIVRELAKTAVPSIEAGSSVGSVTIPEKDASRYSLVKAIRESAAARSGNGQMTGVEAECNQEVTKRTGRTPTGFFIPEFALTRELRDFQKRDLSTLTAGAGSFTVESSVLGTELVSLLRHRMYCMAAGARYLGGLQGNVLIPRQTGPGTAYWLAEQASVTESDQTFGQFSLNPHTLMAQTAYSKQLLAQSSIDVEGLVRMDLNTIIALALDLAALNGSGINGQPLGIYSYAAATGTGTAPSVTFGATATWAKVVSFETNISTLDADVDNMAWITSPAVRGSWKGVAKASNYPVYIWETGEFPDQSGGKGTGGQGIVNGYRAYATNQMTAAVGSAPANGVIFGNWNDLLIANWAGIDVVTDPYTKAATGEIVVTIHLMADIGVRRPNSFSFSIDSGAQ